MKAYVLRRALSFLVTLWLAASLTFFALHIVPGDPAQVMLGIEANPEAVAAVRAQLGLDRPWLMRYVGWFLSLLSFNLGESLAYGVPVSRLLGERLVVTFPLAGLALAWAIAVGIPLGVLAAVRRGTWLDALVSVLAQVGLATPSFWLGVFLMLLFSVRLHWLPAGGFVPWGQGVGGALTSLLLPAAALGVAKAAALARVVRTALLETLTHDYIRTAFSKGLTPRRVIYRHGLRNALVSVFTVLAVETIQLLAGSLVVETVFSLPGLGSLALSAVSNRDIPVVQGIALLLGTVVLAVSFVLDVLYAYLNPRIKYT